MAHKIQNISSSDALEPTSRNKINEGFNAVDIGLKDTQWLSPTYVSATSFTVSGNVTAEATKGRKLRITFATSGAKICTIQSSSYDSPTDKTTITVSGESLVNEAIESVEIDLSPTIDHSKTQNICADPTSPQDVATKNYVDTLGRDGLINPNFTTPLYASANSFTVAGDVTSWLRPGRGLVITFQTSGIKRCIITSLSYNSGTDKTTINTVGDSLVNETITGVLLSLSDGENILKWVNTTGKDSGYLRIGDIQICWGMTSISSDGNSSYYQEIYFPVSFSALLSVSCETSNNYAGGGTSGVARRLVTPLSGERFRVRVTFEADVPSGYYVRFYWIAIGKWQ